MMRSTGLGFAVGLGIACCALGGASAYPAESRIVGAEVTRPGGFGAMDSPHLVLRPGCPERLAIGASLGSDDTAAAQVAPVDPERASFGQDGPELDRVPGTDRRDSDGQTGDVASAGTLRGTSLRADVVADAHTRAFRLAHASIPHVAVGEPCITRGVGPSHTELEIHT